MICMHKLESPKLVNVLYLTRKTLQCVMSLTGYSDVVHMLMHIRMWLPHRGPGAAAGQAGQAGVAPRGQHAHALHAHHHRAPPRPPLPSPPGRAQEVGCIGARCRHTCVFVLGRV